MLAERPGARCAAGGRRHGARGSGVAGTPRGEVTQRGETAEAWGKSRARARWGSRAPCGAGWRWEGGVGERVGA